MPSNKFPSFLKSITATCLLASLCISAILSPSVVIALNTKNSEASYGKLRGKLFDKGVFSKMRISSKDAFVLGTHAYDFTLDWKTILQVSSVSSTSPILVVENKDTADEVSLKLFLEQYKPTKIFVHNYAIKNRESAKLETNINAQLYSYANFVVVADGADYAKSLSA